LDLDRPFEASKAATLSPDPNRIQQSPGSHARMDTGRGNRPAITQMTRHSTWLIVGSVLGTILGALLQHELPLGWLCGALGGGIPFGTFTFVAYQLGRWIGRPMGWALGGPIGLGLGGAVFMVSLAIPRSEIPASILGLMGGAMAGTVCGPI